MQTYISILRGINLAGHNIIKMDDLKKILPKCGFKNIATYIQSGNVVFQYKSTDTIKLDHLIHDKILEEFNFEMPVITLTIDEIKAIANNNPFYKDKKKDPSFFHITFLSDEPHKEYLAKVKGLDYLPDEFVVIGKAIYLYCPNGYGNTKLSNKFFESKLKVSATTRNWKTANELIAISNKVEKI